MPELAFFLIFTFVAILDSETEIEQCLANEEFAQEYTIIKK